MSTYEQMNTSFMQNQIIIKKNRLMNTTPVWLVNLIYFYNIHGPDPLLARFEHMNAY